jgi:glutathione S-transferase
MTQDITLYELSASDGASPSPYVWRIKLALARKQLPYRSRKVRFTEIAEQFGGRFRTVPIVDFDVVQMNESLVIADYLDTHYNLRPSLFACEAERATVEFFNNWLGGSFFPKLLPIYTLDVHNRAASEDQSYYRETRELRLGRTLEEVVADRAERLPATREALAPVRQTIIAQPFLGGEEPNFADMCMLGAFIWVGTVGTLPLLAADDPLVAYAERGLAAFGELTRSLRLNLSEAPHK